MTSGPRSTQRRFRHKEHKRHKEEGHKEWTSRRISLSAATERVASAVIGAAIEVHRHLGPGFLEKIYQEALAIELHARHIAFERERSITVHYKGAAIPGQRLDLVVQSCLIVELKAAARIDPAHEAKLISYLRTTGLRLGLLLNFNARTMKEGVHRVVV